MSGNYYANLRTEMIKFIPENAFTILDVGCGIGNFSSQILNKQTAEIWGVEPDESSAKIAEEKLHCVLNKNFSSDLNLPKKYFDCIIFNDVLEHMTNPDMALVLAKELLKESDSARIICSIPNFRYIKNIFDIIIKKDFLYTDYGILDKTHLHFFTYKSILRLFSINGFRIISCVGINPTKKTFFHILNLLSFNFIQDMKFLQFAVVAKPE